MVGRNMPLSPRREQYAISHEDTPANLRMQSMETHSSVLPKSLEKSQDSSTYRCCGEKEDDSTFLENTELLDMSEEFAETLSSPLKTATSNTFPRQSINIVDESNENLRGIWNPHLPDNNYAGSNEPLVSDIVGKKELGGTFGYSAMERFLACTGPWNPLGLVVKQSVKQGMLESSKSEKPNGRPLCA
ncbi:hypothetical protein GQ43DRAFT_430243 [Delitschia confertaspora ATCC 74209]|uniref:Uncharacterized protein n=1 Tax=Delitschia confertaspora ATCC 74209 TaxID=1513339 RepID=A0A9P4MUF1_9PLEO|nr:hypothetical protein GQ43DRAFT_430243 [Delitschia confertaspora ATCC 74209]